jgi:hypothetical protein
MLIALELAASISVKFSGRRCMITTVVAAGLGEMEEAVVTDGKE